MASSVIAHYVANWRQIDATIARAEREGPLTAESYIRAAEMPETEKQILLAALARLP